MLCHQSVGLIARELEAKGLSTITISLFKAYFEAGKDSGDRQILLQIAEEARSGLSLKKKAARKTQ